jgi:predicted enzyme related to lactoylglutathione lyase
MELFCTRAGESASFYAWLLSTDAETGSDDWEPVRLLFDRAVVGVRRTMVGQQPDPMWVPVYLVEDTDAACRRMEAQGGTAKQLDDRTYLVDASGVWTRVVGPDRLPFGLDPDVVSQTVLDYNTDDVPGVAATYGEVLGLDPVELVDDEHGYTLLVDDKHIAMGVVDYGASPVPSAAWILYFDVPDVRAAMDRAVSGGATVAIPPTDDGYNDWCVLTDPFGVAFGLSTYHDLDATDWLVRLEDGAVVRLGDAATIG